MKCLCLLSWLTCVNMLYIGLELGNALRFHLACVNPIQYKFPDVDNYYGYWNIPLVQTDETGPACAAEDSIDNVYMDNVLAELEARPQMFDTNRLSFSGCSGGATASFWQGLCMHEKYPDKVASFSTHSSGLKVKGDGVKMMSGIWNQYWGECPECQYFPVTPISTPNLKACVFDNYEVRLFDCGVKLICP